jgi:predicted HTH transcriptional regulator
MTIERSPGYLQGLVQELCRLPRETDWVEFKANNDNPHEIGEYVSALANAAALAGKPRAYLLWGVRDGDHALVGTTFDASAAKKGNEELQSWLLRLLEPRVDVRFDAVEVDGRRIVILEVAAAQRQPVRFAGSEFIRVGTYKKPLKDYPEKERALWRAFERVPFEQGVAAQHLPSSEVLRLLDAPAFFGLLRQPLPDGHPHILRGLADNALVAPCPAGGWDITQLGALLLARRLSDFSGLARKAVRLIVYAGATRLKAEREFDEPRGYALCLDDVIRRLVAQLPSREVLHGAFLRPQPDYPEAALRELVANALIHQDLVATGAGPLVEVFDGRVEITNPGEPLVPTERFLDSPPRSRNDALAATMRRLDLCEERGSGIDKVLLQVEALQLPAPAFQVPPGFTRVVLYGPRPLHEMARPERIQICYWHAALRYLHGESLTNASLRARFGMDDASRSLASRYIREAIEAGVLRAVDPEAGPKHMRYLPWWA